MKDRKWNRAKWSPIWLLDPLVIFKKWYILFLLRITNSLVFLLETPLFQVLTTSVLIEVTDRILEKGNHLDVSILSSEISKKDRIYVLYSI